MAAQRKRKTPARTKKTRTRKPKYERVLLFPLEPSVMGAEKIKAAVNAVIDARLKREKSSS
jgi:hypothetical protein